MRLLAQGLEYFDVYDKAQFLELLARSPACGPKSAQGQGRGLGEEERIARQVSFMEPQSPTLRPAESPKLVGKWALIFCGVGRGLQTEPVRKLLKETGFRGQVGVASVTLEVFDVFSMRTSIVIAMPEGKAETVVRESKLSTNSKGEVLSEESGFGRYLKVTYLDDDLLILQGRGPSEVYRRV